MAVRLKDRIEANIRQSDKVNNSLSIQLNSGTATVYDGSAAKSINVTPAAIGAPSTDGTGASGTWNITSASTQRLLSPDTRNTSIIPTETLTGLVADFKAKGTVGITASGGYVGVLTWRSYSTAADLTGGQPIQIAYTQDNELQTRLGNTSTWGSWTKLLNSNNYTSYTVKKDGTGASGTWGISVSGNAATATALATARTFQIADNDATNKGPTASFNGTSNIIINLPSTIKASISGNATTATTATTATKANQLTTARSIALGGQFSGSTSFNGTANVTINGELKKASINGGNTNTYPYRRFAYATPGTGQFSDHYGVFLITKNCENNLFGIIKVSHRTNGSGTACSCSATWLIRSGIAEDAVTIASWGTSGTNNVYFDVYYKADSAWPRTTITALGPCNMTLCDTSEAENAASTTYAYASVATGGTALHNQAYTITKASTQTPIYGAVWN